MKTPETTSLTKQFSDKKETLCLESQQMIPKLPALGKHIEFQNTPKLSGKSETKAEKECILIMPISFYCSNNVD